MRMETTIHKVGRAIDWFSIWRFLNTGFSDTTSTLRKGKLVQDKSVANFIERWVELALVANCSSYSLQ